MADLNNIPAPPPGFELDAPITDAPPPPEGFVVDGATEAPKTPEISEEEELLDVTAAVRQSTFLPKITQQDRVARITEINQMLSGLSADPQHPDSLYRETLLMQRDATLKEYKEESDRELRTRGYEALTKELPDWVTGTAAPFVVDAVTDTGKELAKDIGVSAIAMKGGAAGATGGLMLSGLAGPAQPLAALVTVPTGFMLGAVASGGTAQVLLDTGEELLRGDTPTRAEVLKMASKGGLTGIFSGMLDGVFKGVHALRRMDAATKEKLVSTVYQTLTGSSGRTSASIARTGERKAMEFTEALVDDGYVQSLYAWNETKTVPKQWHKLLDSAKQNIKDKETVKYLDDLMARADSTEATMRDVHDAIKGLHGVSLQSRLADPKLADVKIKIDWDAIESIGFGRGGGAAAKQAVAPGQEAALANAVKRLKKLYGDELPLAEANALKIRGATHSKYFNSTPDSTKSLLNKQLARVIGEGMEASIGKVDKRLLAEIQYHNRVNAAYHEMSPAIARTSAAEFTNTSLQKIANLVKSPDTFAQSLLGGGITGTIAGGVAGTAGGVAYATNEGLDPLSQDWLLAVGAGTAIGAGVGSAAGGMVGQLQGMASQTMSARLQRAKALSMARKLTGPASEALGSLGGAKLAKSLDVFRQDQTQYTMFIGLVSSLMGQDVADAFADMPEEDQRSILVDVSRAAPYMFEQSTEGGLSSVVDGFIVDPMERSIANQKLREERKQGLISQREYQRQVSSINLNGSIATPESMKKVATGPGEDTPEAQLFVRGPAETVDTGLGTKRKITNPADSAKVEEG